MDNYLEGITNKAVLDALLKAKAVFQRHFNIMVSVSGGSDSDVILDISEKVKGNRKVTYVWFDTCLEYQATKDHLRYLEDKYHIEIERIKAIKPIPQCVHEYGVPVFSKYASEYLGRLQRVGFDWSDGEYEELVGKYDNSISTLKWWCNWHTIQDGRVSYFSIERIRLLKEFIMENPPDFSIANLCCEYSKKRPAKKFKKERESDLDVIGIRKAEGGIRAASYKNCFTPGEDHADTFRPIFYFTDADKEYYCEHFGVKHSACYEVYGFKRTGCVGCPYNQRVLEDLKAIEIYEPKLYNLIY